jgi:hypothetical protein
MTTDYYSKAVKKRAKETTTEQDTPQDKERLKITPTTHNTRKKPKTKSSTGGPRQAIGKNFQKSTNGATNQSSSTVTMALGTLC